MMTEMNRRVNHKTFDAEKILEKVPLLSTLTNDERKKLAEGLHHKEFKSGEKLMTEGEEGNSFYIIVSGKVDVLTEKGGKIATLEDGDYAGEQALLQNAKRNATLIAMETTTTLICYQKLFKSILAENTSVKFAKRDGKRLAFLTTLNEDIKLDEEEKEKDDETTNWLLESISTNILFANLDLQQRKRIVKKMELIDVSKNDKIIVQGDIHSSTFYVVDQGIFDAFIDQAKVFQYKRGGCFGELALLYDAPRAATICAMTNGKLWVTDRNVFRYEVTITTKKIADQQLQFLKQIPLLKPLLNQELSILSDALEETKYTKETIIFNEGDKGDKFYIIKSGIIKWSKKNGEKGELQPMNVFGERALRTNEPRAATIEAKTDVALLEMAAKDFNELLGPIIDIIDEKINSYKRANNQKKEDIEGEKRKKTITNDSKQKVNERKKKKICELNELKTIGILGKGGFGLVKLVIDSSTNISYALKSIKKKQIVELGLEKHITSEKKVMNMMDNNFLVNLHRTFKDKFFVYFLLDVCLGGELFTILRNKRYFSEHIAKFYAACVIEGFDYMHSLDIIYRDLKPENLVLDSNGYLKITDFGFAKICTDKTFTLCGTPDYLCPEIVTGQGHCKAVDWWTLGILIYEMLASFPPFVADDPIETYKKILSGKIRFPRYFSQDACLLIKELLHHKPTKRLGVLKGGANNIRNHTWYNNFKWEWLRQRQMPAPIVNQVKDATDLSNFSQIEVDQDDDLRPLSKEEEQCFKDF